MDRLREIHLHHDPVSERAHDAMTRDEFAEMVAWLNAEPRAKIDVKARYDWLYVCARDAGLLDSSDGAHVKPTLTCTGCGLERMLGAPDPCIGYLPGVRYACCGHGRGDSYIYFENGVTITGAFAEIARRRVDPADERGPSEVERKPIISLAPNRRRRA